MVGWGCCPIACRRLDRRMESYGNNFVDRLHPTNDENRDKGSNNNYRMKTRDGEIIGV